MFRISPGARELLRYHLSLDQIAGQMPIIVWQPEAISEGRIVGAPGWACAYIEREKVVGREDELLHTIDGIDLIIDNGPASLEDLARRTMMRQGHRFVFVLDHEIDPSRMD